MCIIISNSVLLEFEGIILCVTAYESIVINSAKIANLPDVLDLNTLYPELNMFL